MRRICICVALALLAASVVAGAASASPSEARARPYREQTRSVIVSTAQNFTTSSGRVTGTPVVRGTGTGSETASATPPACGSGSGSSISGSITTVANDGDIVYNSFTGSVCESAATPTSTTYQLAGTFTITGGTGRYAGASGGGTLTSTITLHPTPQGSQGPAISHARGTIYLT